MDIEKVWAWVADFMGEHAALALVSAALIVVVVVSVLRHQAEQRKVRLMIGYLERTVSVYRGGVRQDYPELHEVSWAVRYLFEHLVPSRTEQIVLLHDMPGRIKEVTKIVNEQSGNTPAKNVIRFGFWRKREGEGGAKAETT